MSGKHSLILSLVMAVGLALIMSPAVAAAPPAPFAQQTTLDKAAVAELLSKNLNDITRGQPFAIKHPKLGPLTVSPTINPQMQRRAEKLLASNRDRRAALVVVEADTGRLLALAGIKRRRKNHKIGLQADAPSASLFKVVTAAAALEEVHLAPSTRLTFVGRPHTLFRYQLKERTRRRCRVVTLSKSFANSNNPIFARLGVHKIGGDLLLWYARALGFDRRLPFELPLEVSKLPEPANDFQLGELACGYHRHTTMSPLHAALMVSVFINGGRFMEPFAVDRVIGAAGEVLYLGRPKSKGRLVSKETCESMRELFEATVTKGTARRAFRRVNRDSILKGLQLGGKTGTLRGPDRTELFTWFAGYGRDPDSGKALAICALVVHGKVRYSNPKRMARKMLKEAFRITQAKASTDSSKKSPSNL
jgi:peptidoglycan glycosyltransferase